MRKNEKFGTVRVKPPRRLGGAAKAAFTYFLLILQVAVIAALYGFVAWKVRTLWYLSLAFTAAAGVRIAVSETDAQCKTSWLLLMLLSCGSGWLICIFADKNFCYGGNKRKFDSLYNRSKTFSVPFIPVASRQVKNDCAYLFNAGGFVARTGTDIAYFGDTQSLMKDMFARIAKAEKFIFLEFFIIAEGALLERLVKILKRKAAEGVEIRLLYDDLGSQGIFSFRTKKSMREAGIKLKKFSPLLAPFGFGLNYRDHRKIVVVDGKTSYVCGCNIADECVNARRMNAAWKDAGLRLDGCAVDDASLMFLRQWDFENKTQSDWGEYLGRYKKTDNTAAVVQFAGGPDLTEPVCRGLYANVISGATERLYIMSPYFIPDSGVVSRLKEKALSGVDVRLVLPAVPDWKFVYKVTTANAEKLISSGVKVYYVQRTFLHSKVMLTENCAVVGSVNMDMRSFYQQFDNAVYTNDGGVLKDILSDFNSVFALNSPATPKKRNTADKLLTSLLKILSPLM